MKTEKFDIRILWDGQQQQYPVEIFLQGENVCICVMINGREVHFLSDEYGTLRPAAMACDLDPQLLYQVGRAIRQQRPAVIY